MGSDIGAGGLTARTAQLWQLFEAYTDACADPSCDTRRMQLHALGGQAAAAGLMGAGVLPLLEQLLQEQAALVDDTARFTQLYRFAFFVAREPGSRALALPTALLVWPLLLRGRFRLLPRFLEFVAAQRRPAVSEDTWRQVLDFSRLVHEDVSNYDPLGAWPVLIDDFVDALCGRPQQLEARRRRESEGGDGYAADGEGADGACGPGCPPALGSKRRAPFASSGASREVDGIAERLSRMSASPVPAPQRRRLVAGREPAWGLEARLREKYGADAIVSFTGTHRLLSNFAAVPPFCLNGLTFTTSEAAFHSFKSTDPFLRTLFSTLTPGKAKALGRRVMREGQNATPGWYSHARVEAMEQVLAAKFALGSPSARALMNTGDRLLVEGNTWGDTYWGDTGSTDSENMLGTLLMQRRAWLLENAGALSAPAARERAAAPAAPKPASKRRKVAVEEVIVID